MVVLCLGAFSVAHPDVPIRLWKDLKFGWAKAYITIAPCGTITQRCDTGKTKMKTTEKIEYETYYVFCPYCQELITDLTDDSPEIQVCENYDCRKEFKIK